jgi:hypothetical protein
VSACPDTMSGRRGSKEFACARRSTVPGREMAAGTSRFASEGRSCLVGPWGPPRFQRAPRASWAILRGVWKLYTRRRTNKIVRVRQRRRRKVGVMTHEAIGAWRILGGDDCAEQHRGLAGVFDWSGSGG